MSISIAAFSFAVCIFLVILFSLNYNFSYYNLWEFTQSIGQSPGINKKLISLYYFL
jgi:hypothetical protein